MDTFKVGTRETWTDDTIQQRGCQKGLGFKILIQRTKKLTLYADYHYLLTLNELPFRALLILVQTSL